MSERLSTNMDLARRALAHYVSKTTDQASDIMQMPVDAYINPDRYQHEITRIYKRLPLALALSLELPETGSYRATTMAGTPVVMVRGDDGQVRAFLNVCRHRGAPVCNNGQGQADRFVCPYHAWVYNRNGHLTHMYGGDTFGEIDQTQHGLTALPVAERAGLIWVALSPDAVFDIDEWLGTFAPELETLTLNDWHLFEQRELPGPGWKVTWDGYLEAYHHNTLHADTVGKYTVGKLVVHDTYGPHQRITFARRSIGELLDIAESEWEPEQHIRLIHSVFPNLSISGVVGDHCLVSQLFPGPTPETTLTRQTVLSATKPETEDARAASENFSALVLKAVQDEDYAMGYRIQQGMEARADGNFLFGRNEPAVQHYHQNVAAFSKA